MIYKKKILLVGTVFLAIAMLLGVFAFLVSTGSFSIGSYHTGTTGEKGSTTSYTFRSTTTYQQPGDKEMTTSSYSMNLGWLSLGSLQITSTTISPYIVINGSNVTLSISANNAENVWASITKPDSSQENLTLTNNAGTFFTNTTLLDRYNVTFYANDTSGNMVSSSEDYFESFRAVTFNFTVIGSVGTGVDSSWELIYRNAVVESSSSSTGDHSVVIPDTTADLRFKDETQRLQVTLEDINVTLENNKQFGVEKHPRVTGYLATYAVDNPDNYSFTNATVKIYYDDLTASITSESNLQLHMCDNYDYAGRSCSETWIDSSASQDTSNDYFEYNVSSFSGFSIKQYVTPPGGDGAGGGGASSGSVSGCGTGYEMVNGTCVKIREIPGQLFDITFTLDDYLIQSSDELTAVVTFESFGVEPTPINLTFTILDEFGTAYAVDNDFIVVTTEEVLRKKFEALYLSEGEYVIVLDTLYNVNVSDKFRQEFEIGEERGISLWIWIIGGGIVVGGLIIWLIYWIIKRKKKKTYKARIEEPASFKGKVSHILRKGRIRHKKLKRR